MKQEGVTPEGVEAGNAWDLHMPGSETNWIVGDAREIDSTSLRFVKGGPDGVRSRNVKVKVFVHRPDDDPTWGQSKLTSVGRTLVILAGEGKVELTFTRGHTVCKLTLDTPNDFVIWGPGLEHSWMALKESTLVTVRWIPEAPAS